MCCLGYNKPSQVLHKLQTASRQRPRMTKRQLRPTGALASIAVKIFVWGLLRCVPGSPRARGPSGRSRVGQGTLTSLDNSGFE